MNKVLRSIPEFKYAYILVAITLFIQNLIGFYLPLYLDNLGFSGTQIGILMGVSWIPAIIFVFHMGIFTDRLTTKVVAGIGIVVSAMFFFGIGYYTLFGILLIVFFLGGLGNRMFIISMDSMTLKKEHKSKGTLYGIYTAVETISSALGLLVGGYLLYVSNFSLILKLLGVASLLSLILLFKIPKTKKSVNSVVAYLRDFKNPRVIWFSILLFIFTLHWGVEKVAYSLFLRENLGLNYIQMGWYMSIPVIFLAASALWFGKEYDKGFSSKKLLLFSFFVSGGFLALMALTSNPYFSFVFRVIHEIGDGAFSIVLFTGAATYFKSEKMGGNFGLILLILGLGGFVGSLIFSPLGAAWGYEWPHIICGALVVVSGLFIWARK